MKVSRAFQCAGKVKTNGLTFATKVPGAAAFPASLLEKQSLAPPQTQ